MKNTELINSNCSIVFRPEEKEVFCRDFTDRNNDPAFYNKSKRGLAKAFEALVVAWDDSFTLRKASDFLNEHGIRTHYWCMMD